MHHRAKYSPSEGSRPPQSPLARCEGRQLGVLSGDGELVSPRGRVVRDGEAVDAVPCTEHSQQTSRDI